MFVLQQLNFKNWIPFYGNQKIIFSVDPNKNITFIEADNMAGKTSIYRGILWCMFGDTGDKDEEYSKYIDRLNLQAMGEKDYKYQVELKLKFKGKKYVITRKAELKSDAKIDESNWEEFLSCNIDSDDSVGIEAQKNINKIFDMTTSRFYLFDGEMLSEYKKLIKSNNMGGLAKKIIDAIEDILRITSLRNAKKSLDAIHTSALKQANQEKNKDTNVQKALNTLEKKGKLLKELKKEKEKLVKNKIKAEKKAEDARKILENNPDQKQLAQEVKDLAETKIPNCKTNILDLEKVVRANASLIYLRVLDTNIRRIKKQITKRLEALEKKIDQYKKIDVYNSILNDLDISIESKAVIEQQMPNINIDEKQKIDNQIFDLKAKLLELNKFNSGQANMTILVEKYNQLKKEKYNFETYKARHEEILLRSGGKDNVDSLQKQWEILQSNSELIGKIEEKLDESIENSNAWKIKTLKSEINIIEDTIPKTKAKTIHANKEIIARKYKNFFEASIKTMVDETKSLISKSANEMYSKLSAYRVFVNIEKTGTNLEITENFGLQLRTSSGNKLAASAGGANIVALSLITALRNQLPESPFLMDTPFGRLDLKFREGVLTLGPKMGTQFILLVQDGEVAPNSELHGIIRDKIGSTYKLNKMDDDVTEIEQL